MIQELKRIANVKVDSPNRKSKILGSLAFLAGLSVSDLTSAPNTKTNTKLPPVALNEASRIPPHIAAIYNPYSYLTHPYILSAPLNFYPLWDPLRLLSLNGMHNNFQTLPERLQSLSSSDKATDLSNDQYVDEAMKVEKVKASSETGDNMEEGEFDVEVDRTMEDKMMTPDTACSAQKKVNMAAFNELEDDSKQNTHANINATSSNTTVNPIQNSTGNYNHTSYPFYGYYGGYPQNINHVDITTETNEYKYHDYEHINYNLPSYDKPINFYSDQRYNYYSAPPGDPYVSNQFQQEQIPEYFSNDFKRYLYTPDNSPSLSNHGFRPII
nr:PREDICTED: uncharacterized protein LOC105662032 [Megachile rotundata]